MFVGRNNCRSCQKDFRGVGVVSRRYSGEFSMKLAISLSNTAEFPTKVGKMALVRLSCLLGSHGKAVFLRGDHLDQLMLSDVQGVEPLRVLSSERAYLGPHRVRKVGDDPGVDPICLGQAADGLRKVPDLTGIGNHHRKGMNHQGIHHIHLHSLRGFQNDELGKKGFKVFKVFHKQGKTFLGIGEGFLLSNRPDVNLEFFFGISDVFPSFPALRNTGSFQVQAPVRVKGKKGCDDPCFYTSFILKVNSVYHTHTKNSFTGWQRSIGCP